MNCYYHPDRESVVSCPKCGRPMCRDCESNALYRPNGAAYCIRCSMDAIGAAIRNSKKEMRKRTFLLILAAVEVLVGLGFTIYVIATQEWGNLFVSCLMFAMAGMTVVASKMKKQEGISSSDIYWTVNSAVSPVSTLVAGVLWYLVGYGIAGPILFTVEIYKYFKDKRELEKLIHVFEARVDEEMNRESTSSEYFVQEIKQEKNKHQKTDADETGKAKKKTKMIVTVVVLVIAVTMLGPLVTTRIKRSRYIKEQEEIYSQPAVLYLH